MIREPDDSQDHSSLTIRVTSGEIGIDSVPRGDMTADA